VTAKQHLVLTISSLDILDNSSSSPIGALARISQPCWRSKLNISTSQCRQCCQCRSLSDGSWVSTVYCAKLLFIVRRFCREQLVAAKQSQNRPRRYRQAHSLFNLRVIFLVVLEVVTGTGSSIALLDCRVGSHSREIIWQVAWYAGARWNSGRTAQISEHMRLRPPNAVADDR
jgi:hypothetical protein